MSVEGSWKTIRLPAKLTGKKPKYDFVFNQESKKKANTSFACKLCKRKYSSNMKLFRHMFTHNDNRERGRRRFRERRSPLREKPFSCHICNNTFSHETTLRLHRLAHENEQTFSCETCSEEFPSLGRLQKHCLIEHADEPAHQTDDSSEQLELSFNTLKNNSKETRYVKKHIRDYDAQAYSSTQSKKDSYVNDKSHINVADVREHCFRYMDQKPFACDDCGMMFITKSNYEKHIIAHDFTKPKLKRPLYMRRKKAIQEKCLLQKECGIEEESENTPENKISEHLDEDSLLQEKVLVSHISSEPILNDKVGCKKRLGKSTKKQKKVFDCEVCKRQLASNRSLANHLKTHSANYTGSKTFMCRCIKKSGSNNPAHHHENETTDGKGNSESNNLISNCLTEMEEVNNPACYSLIENKSGDHDTCRLKKNPEIDDATSYCFSEKAKDDKLACCLTEKTEGNDIVCHQPRDNDHTCCPPNEEMPREEFKCNVCHKNYRLKIALMSHMISHSAPKLKCEVCGKEFSSNKLLKLHFRRHSDVRFFFCQLCNKGFKHKHNLQVHFITHTDEKPYVCELCSKGFKHKWGLKVHMQMHQKDPPFVCGVCDMGFFVKSELKKHLLLHEEAAFECEYCGLGFMWEHQLTKHIAIHAEESQDRSSTVSNQDFESFTRSDQTIESCTVSDQRIKPCTVSIERLNPSMISSQGFKTSTVSCQEIEFSAISRQGIEPSMVPSQGIEPSMVPRQGIEPSMVPSQGIEPSMVSSQGIEPSPVSCQEMESSIVSCQEIKLSTLSSQGIESSTVSNQGIESSTVSILGIQPFTVSSQGMEESSGEINIINPLHESSQEPQTEWYLKDPVITEMIFEESSEELQMSFKESSQELIREMLLKKSIKKEIIWEKSGKKTTTEMPLYESSMRTLDRVSVTNKCHVCEICKKGFKSKKYLRSHGATHTLDRKYACERCSKKFKTRAYLTNHVRNVHIEKPYGCDVCGKRFKFECRVKIHALVHRMK